MQLVRQIHRNPHIDMHGVDVINLHAKIVMSYDEYCEFCI